MKPSAWKLSVARLYGFMCRHPHMCAVLIAVKRSRTRFGFVACAVYVLAVMTQGVSAAATCLSTGCMVVGYSLIGVGTGIRVAALGVLDKKEALATAGAYSLCRHPLYLGSMLIAFGFCCLLQGWLCWLMAGAYFAVFYPLIIIWEEVRLRERYGTEHEMYVDRVPLLFPAGKWARSQFSWRRARANGVFGLILAVTSLTGLATGLHVTHPSLLRPLLASHTH